MSLSGVEKIVERQMRNWELAREQRQGPSDAAPTRFHTYVAISRQKSSGGSALGRCLGERTGWQIYDREILDYMAEDDAVQKRIYEVADEHPEGHFETFLRNLGFEGQPPGADYFRKLVSSVRAIAQSEHAIFVGRGAGFILPPEPGFRVRVIASMSTRCARYTESAGEEAESKIKELDLQRERFVRDQFRIDPTATEHYDAIINTDGLSTEAAAAMVIAGLESKTDLAC
ncbi:MAG: cytidylate kinase-like family protein [bacterium]|nr:cytidylate kinase-like family protein [bacterium]